jgi:hypothetical protein
MHAVVNVQEQYSKNSRNSFTAPPTLTNSQLVKLPSLQMPDVVWLNLQPSHITGLLFSRCVKNNRQFVHVPGAPL